MYTTRAGGSVTWLQERSGNATDEFGLRCVICSQKDCQAESSFSHGSYGRAGTHLQIKDLLEHQHTARHLKAVKRILGPEPSSVDTPAQPDDSDGLPSAAQFSLSRSIANNPFSAQGAEYARQHSLLRDANTAWYPKAHGNRTQHGQHIAAIARTAFDQDRALFLQKKVRASSWAEDACGGYTLVMLKMVLKDYTVQPRLFALVNDDEGDKSALSKVALADRLIREFSLGNADLEAAVRQSVKAGGFRVWGHSEDMLWQAWCCDGEPAELAAGHLARARQTMPKLLAVQRCFMHITQKSMEKSLGADPKIQMLLDKLVLQLSGGARKGEYGGLARALSNSKKLLSRFHKEELRDLTTLSEFAQQPQPCSSLFLPRAWVRQTTSTCSFAAQRFNTVTDQLRLVCVRLNPLLEFLTNLRLEGGPSGSWAAKLLEARQLPDAAFPVVLACAQPCAEAVFTLDNLALTSLVAEWSCAVSRFVHQWDNQGRGFASQGRNGVQHITLLARKTRMLREDCPCQGHFSHSHVALAGAQSTVRLQGP